MEGNGNNMNPEELVTISNKKTGEIKRVPRKQLPSFGLSPDYTSKLDMAIQAVQGGKMAIPDLPAEQRAIVASSLPETFKSPEQTAAQKATNEVKDTVGNIDTILNKNLKFVTGIASPLSLVPGTDAFDTRRQIQQVKDQLSLASVGKLKGQGQVSDAERKLLANASTALDLGMSEKAFRAELAKVKKILNRNIGEENVEPQPFTGEAGNKQTFNIFKSLLGGSINFGKDIGVALGLKGKSAKELEKSQQQTMEMSQKTAKAATTATDPEIKKRLLAVSRSAGGLVAGQTAKPEQMFSEDINKGYLSRGLDVSTEVATLAEIPALIKSIPSLGKKLSNITSPSKAIGVMRDTAVSEAEKKGVKFSGTSIKKAAEEYVAQDPLSKNIADKVLPTIKDTIKPTELMKKLDIWNKAYTAAGRAGKSSKAGLYDVLARTAKEQISQKAPDVAKATKLFSNLYRNKKIVGKLTSPVLGAAGGALGGMAIGKALGRQ